MKLCHADEHASLSAPATAASRTASTIAWLKAQPELLLASVAAVMLLAGLVVHLADGPQWLRYAFAALCYIMASRYTAVLAFQSMGGLRFNIDVLMFIAAFGAAAIGQIEEGGLLLVLFALGTAGERIAFRRANRAIEELSQLAPETARLHDTQGQETVVPAESVQAGQNVVVRPFERIPLDGAVREGTSLVDQSTITGESVPVRKAAGDAVFAGTINGDGRLMIQVSRPAASSTLARIIKLVADAQATRSPTQIFTDKVERFYVPLVLIATAAMISIPPLLGLPHRQEGSLWAGWFYQAMGFLAAASPCALAIGTPSAVLCGIAKAARIGALIKGGAYLEVLGQVKVIAFDKTGTLTVGRPVLTDVVVLDETDEDEVLAMAASLDRESNHPLAAAITAEAHLRHCPLYHATDVEQIPGVGIVGRVNGRSVAVGQMDAAGDDETAPRQHLDRMAQEGKATVRVLIDGRCVGVLGLADRPRDEARRTIAELKHLGIGRTIMLTGDHSQAAATIARAVGVDAHAAELLPENKLALIRRLRERHGCVAMVGDGVNDAPALAAASIGIAMGGAGRDVAMETADVVLMSSDLRRLPEAIALSRRAREIILQNLLIALSVIVAIAPAAAAGVATLGMAVALHEGSTIVVVLNSLRLLRYRPGQERLAPAESPQADLPRRAWKNSRRIWAHSSPSTSPTTSRR